MKKLGLIAAAAAVLALTGCNNGAQDVRITGVEMGSVNYYDVEGTAKVTISATAVAKVGDKTETVTTTQTLDITATEASLGKISVAPQYTDTNQTVYEIELSGLSAKSTEGNVTTEIENLPFGLTIVEMGGDYYLTGDLGLDSYEDLFRFAGNTEYIKLEDFGGPEDLVGTVTITETYKPNADTTVTVKVTYTLDLELSKI